MHGAEVLSDRNHIAAHIRFLLPTILVKWVLDKLSHPSL
jgi:hypothetical protein